MSKDKRKLRSAPTRAEVQAELDRRNTPEYKHIISVEMGLNFHNDSPWETIKRIERECKVSSYQFNYR